MPPAALGLVLTAAVLHACWNLAAKRVDRDGMAFVWWYNLFSAALWLPVGVILLTRAGWPLSWPLLLAPLLSAGFHLAYQLSLQTGYQRAELGVVYPTARGVGPLLTVLVAVLVLGERPGVTGLVGGLVIIGGIVIVAAVPRTAAPPSAAPAPGDAAHGAGPSGVGHRHRARAGVAWGALTGAAIAAYTLWDDHSMTALALLPIPYFALSCAWQTLLLAPAAARAGSRHGGGPGLGRVLRRTWKEVAVVAVGSPLAYVLVLQVMRTVPVSLVAPARESSIVVGALLGWWLFKEPHPVRRLLGAAVVLAGITLVVV